MTKLITFADGNLGIKSAGRRLIRQGMLSNYFDGGCEVWNLKRLEAADPIFKQMHSKFLRANKKGFGLWVWQPAFLLAAMNQTPDGEVLVALDAGCQIVSNQGAAARMEAYVSEAVKNEFLFVQIKEGSFGVEDLSEIAWTKSSCIDYFQATSIHLESTQIQSGIIFVLNSEKTREFVSRWYANCVRDEYHLLVDPTADEPQCSRFSSHRYTQSILSLMVKQESLARILDETYWFPNWLDGQDFPIWSMRNRSGGDAFRRNLLDLLLIGFAKVEREFKKILSDS
jgi:hypothetical protein